MNTKYIEWELQNNRDLFYKPKSGNFVDSRLMRHVVCNVNKPDGISQEAFEAVLNAVAEEIDLIPATPLVRCADCKYSHEADDGDLWCYGFTTPARLVYPAEFCSHGA